MKMGDTDGDLDKIMILESDEDDRRVERPSSKYKP